MADSVPVTPARRSLNSPFSLSRMAEEQTPSNLLSELSSIEAHLDSSRHPDAPVKEFKQHIRLDNLLQICSKKLK